MFRVGTLTHSRLNSKRCIVMACVGAPRCAHRATDAGGLVLHHHPAQGVEIVGFHRPELLDGNAEVLGREMGEAVVGDQLAQADQPDQVLRTHIHAAVAGHAVVGIEDRVDVAPQAARALPAGLGLGERLLHDVHRRGPAVAFDHRRFRATQQVPVLHHRVGGREPLFADRDVGTGAAQEIMHRPGGDLGRRDRVDEQPRAVGHIAAGEHIGRRGLVGLRVHLDQPALVGHAVFRRQERQVRGLADGEHDGIGLDVHQVALIELAG